MAYACIAACGKNLKGAVLTGIKSPKIEILGLFISNPMVAYFCHHLSDNYVDLSDLYVDLSDLYVDLSLIPSVEK